MAAVNAKEFEVLEALIKTGVYQGNKYMLDEALYSALSNNDHACARILLDDTTLDLNNIDYYKGKFYALHEAASEGCVEMCRFLISRGIEKNTLNAENQTALDCAEFNEERHPIHSDYDDEDEVLPTREEMYETR